MEDPQKDTKTILKAKKGGLVDIFILIFFVGSLIYSFQLMHSVQVPGGNPLRAWALCLLSTYLFLHYSHQHLPGQGDIILTPEGFQVKALKPGMRRNFAWSDVSRFYVAKVAYNGQVNYTNHETLQMEKACFDTLVPGKQQSLVVSVRKYDLSPEQVVSLLNSWKAKYDPN